jgi:hypothetical protein
MMKENIYIVTRALERLLKREILKPSKSIE